MAQRIQRAWRVLRQDGFAVFLKRVFDKARNRFQGYSPSPGPVSVNLPDSSYTDWIIAHEPGLPDIARQRVIAAALAYQTPLSILTPLYNTEPALRRALLASLLAARYPTM